MNIEPIRLETPLQLEDVEPLRSGDVVRLYGAIYAARDAAHARIKEAIDKGEPLPFDPEGQAVYYTGPAQARPDSALGPAGPTPASRMDPYAPLLIERRLWGKNGKGVSTVVVFEAVAGTG